MIPLPSDVLALFDSPEKLWEFMDLEVNLEYPYRNMTQEEVRAVQGENKWVRILTIYVRAKIQARSRIRLNLHNHRLEFVSLENIWVELPRWVQEVYKLEQVDPSPDFHALCGRVMRYYDEWDKLHHRS